MWSYKKLGDFLQECVLEWLMKKSQTPRRVVFQIRPPANWRPPPVAVFAPIEAFLNVLVSLSHSLRGHLSRTEALFALSATPVLFPAATSQKVCSEKGPLRTPLWVCRAFKRPNRNVRQWRKVSFAWYFILKINFCYSFHKLSVFCGFGWNMNVFPSSKPFLCIP